jgi:putative endonuclease
MAVHNEVGKMGEDLAADFFEKRQHVILHRNWRSGNKEIDMITLHNNVIHFVEVKTRSTKKFGFPEGSVSRAKFRNLSRAAEEFLLRNAHYNRIQFDILSINILPDQQNEYFIIEDVFFN